MEPRKFEPNKDWIAQKTIMSKSISYNKSGCCLALQTVIWKFLGGFIQRVFNALLVITLRWTTPSNIFLLCPLSSLVSFSDSFFYFLVQLIIPQGFGYKYQKIEYWCLILHMHKKFTHACLSTLYWSFVMVATRNVFAAKELIKAAIWQIFNKHESIIQWNKCKFIHVCRTFPISHKTFPTFSKTASHSAKFGNVQRTIVQISFPHHLGYSVDTQPLIHSASQHRMNNKWINRNRAPPPAQIFCHDATNSFSNRHGRELCLSKEVIFKLSRVKNW